MGYLDSAGLSHFWAKVKSALAGKQDALTPDGTIRLRDGAIGVALPAKAVSRAELQKLYLYSDDGGGEAGGDGLPGGRAGLGDGSDDHPGVRYRGRVARAEVVRRVCGDASFFHYTSFL